MAKVGWIVQSAFYGRNSHATRETNPSLCREAAQSNISLHWTGSSRFSLVLIATVLAAAPGQ